MQDGSVNKALTIYLEEQTAGGGKREINRSKLKEEDWKKAEEI